MVFGYVLVSLKNSYEHEVADKLSMLDEVVEVQPLIVEDTALADPFFEEFELIVKIKAKNSKDLKKFEDKIYNINGVEKTKVITKPRL